MLFFSFVEYPSVSRIKFVGNKKIGVSSLLGTIRLRRNEIANERKIKEDVEALKKYYYGQGYPKTEVEYELTPDITVPGSSCCYFFI